MENNKPIYVTKPSLAPLEDYVEILKSVWDCGILTHNGPLVQQFEREICSKLNVSNFVCVTNGTIAIQMAIKTLKLKGEIITTPFTWIATLSAIKWENCTPIFCDIDPDTLNIDPAKIEDLISKNTSAILPVHVFGNPCDVESIDGIAKKHNLKVIYDAAHAIGSIYKKRSILECGDISATSLHATKLLNSAEGGGCVANEPELLEKLVRMRFFGHDDKNLVVDDGFNGKMTEVHAALGLANLKYYDEILADRKYKYMYYLVKLSPLDFLSFQSLKYGESNYSYFPVVFNTDVSVAINKDLTFKVFGTFQQTKLENLYANTLWDCFNAMGATNQLKIQQDGVALQVASGLSKLNDGDATTNPTAAEANLISQVKPADIPAMITRATQIVGNGYKAVYKTSNEDIVNGSIKPDKLVDVDHVATPSFYGGASADYSPIPKLHIGASMYFYTENTLLQTKLNDIGRYTIEGLDKTDAKNNLSYNPNDYSSVYTIEPKFILNMKVSYNVWKECSVFVNTRNLLNSAKREFAYLDEIKGLYFIGMNLSF